MATSTPTRDAYAPPPGGSPHAAGPIRSADLAEQAVAVRRQGVAVRLHSPVLSRLRRLRSLPAALHRVDRPAPGGDDRPEPDGVGRLGELRQDPARRGVLDGRRQHLPDRGHVDGPAAARRPGPGPSAELPAARQHLLADGRPHPVRHLGGLRRPRLRPGLPGRRRSAELAAALRRARRHQLGQRPLDFQDRDLRHRHLALDRLQRPDLSGRHAGRADRSVRGGLAGRRVALAAVPQGDHPLAAAHDPLHDRHLDHRLHAAVRRATAPGGRASSGPPAAARISTRRSASTSTTTAGISGTSVRPPQWPGRCSPSC